MCKEFKIAQKTVEEFVHTKDRFTYNELSDEILKRGGVLAVAIGTGVDEYLKYFVRQKQLDYDSWKRVYFKRQSAS
jgi:hypothetical protein